MTNEATASDYIKRITESGTAYERAILLANSAAHWAYGSEPIDPPLTPEEHTALIRSFRSYGDKEVFQRYRNIDEVVRLLAVQLSQYLIEHDLIQNQIRHLNSERIMLNVTVPEFCDVIGSGIAKRFGAKAQVEVFKEVSKHKLSRIFGSKAKLDILTDQETGERKAMFSFPDFDLPATAEEVEGVSDEAYFINCLIGYGRRLSESRRKAKVTLLVIQEVLKANRFNVKPYKHFLKRAEKTLRQEPPLEVLKTTEELRQEAAKATDKETKRIYGEIANNQEKKRALLWRTYDEIEITDEDKTGLRNVVQGSGVAYAKKQ